MLTSNILISLFQYFNIPLCNAVQCTFNTSNATNTEKGLFKEYLFQSIPERSSTGTFIIKLERYLSANPSSRIADINHPK